MVPGQPFNEMKPDSGDARWEPGRLPQRNIAITPWMHAKLPSIPWAARRRSSSRRICFIIDEMRQPFPHFAWFVEMIGHAHGASPDRKGEAAEIRDDGKHALVGDVVAPKDRTAAFERFMGHQFGDT